MAVGESGSRPSRALRRDHGGMAKGICPAPTRELCEPLRCPYVERGERGNKVQNHVATRFHYDRPGPNRSTFRHMGQGSMYIRTSSLIRREIIPKKSQGHKLVGQSVILVHRVVFHFPVVTRNFHVLLHRGSGTGSWSPWRRWWDV